MFNFNIRHIFDKKHTATDELSRKFCEFPNNIDKIYKKNIDNFIDDQFNCMQICLIQINENDNEQSLKNEYFEKFQRIIYYLITLTRFNHLN